MFKPVSSAQPRRDFLFRDLPLCALSGLALAGLPLAGQTAAPAQAPEQAPHKFDAEIPRKMTMRLAFRMQYATAFIPYLEFCAKTAGRDAVIATLKAYAEDGAGPGAADSVRRLGGERHALRPNSDFHPDRGYRQGPRVARNRVPLGPDLSHGQGGRPGLCGDLLGRLCFRQGFQPGHRNGPGQDPDAGP